MIQQEVRDMEFIDINCMLGEWGNEHLRFKTAEGLRFEMKRLNIRKALAFHSRSWLYDPRSGNASIIEAARENDDIMPVMVLTSLIEREFGGREALYAFIRENRVRAVRLFPIDHNYTLNLWNVDKLFSAMNEIKMPVMLDFRQKEGSMEASYGLIHDIARAYPDTPVILLTTGYRSLRVLYGLFESCRNIHTDTSTFITFHGIEDVVRNFGSDRILFGTRMPFIEGGVSVGRVIYSDLRDSEKEDIAWRNIYSILGRNTLLQYDRGSAL